MSRQATQLALAPLTAQYGRSPLQAGPLPQPQARSLQMFAAEGEQPASQSVQRRSSWVATHMPPQHRRLFGQSVWRAQLPGKLASSSGTDTAVSGSSGLTMTTDVSRSTCASVPGVVTLASMPSCAAVAASLSRSKSTKAEQPTTRNELKTQ